MPIHLVILVGALQMQPSLCTTQTAIDVTRGPHVQNELMRGKLGQALRAGTAIAPRDGIEYVKVTCFETALPSQPRHTRWLSSPFSYLARLL
jgi:hypothetical protein